MGWEADAWTTMVSVVHISSGCRYLCFSPHIHREGNVHSHKYDLPKLSLPEKIHIVHIILFSFSGSEQWCCGWDDSSVLLAPIKSKLDCVHWRECAGIGVQELKQGNGYPSMHKFPGNLPPSSSPQICLASASTPQPHQAYTDVG